MKLGGWTRAWIVLSVVYALFVALAAYYIRPKFDHTYDQWIDAQQHVTLAQAINDPKFQALLPGAKRLVLDKLMQQDSKFQQLSPVAQAIVKRKLGAAVSTFNPDDPIVATPAMKRSAAEFLNAPTKPSAIEFLKAPDVPANASGASTAPTQKPDPFGPYFRQRELWFALKAFGLWLGGTILLYLMGWSIGWIVRGFRK